MDLGLWNMESEQESRFKHRHIQHSSAKMDLRRKRFGRDVAVPELHSTIL